MQSSVVLHKRSNQIIPYILRCSKCRSAPGASNTWFESAHITMKRSLSLVNSWLHNMTEQIAADEMEVNIK